MAAVTLRERAVSTYDATRSVQQTPCHPDVSTKPSPCNRYTDERIIEQDLTPPQNVEIPGPTAAVAGARHRRVSVHGAAVVRRPRDVDQGHRSGAGGQSDDLPGDAKGPRTWRTPPRTTSTPIGTVGIIMRMLKLPDERIKILVQGLSKAKISGYIQTDPYYSVRIEKLTETKPAAPPSRREAVMRTVKEQIERIVSLGKVLIPDVMVVIENLEDPGRLADMVASNLGLKVEVTQAVLEVSIRSTPAAVSEILGKGDRSPLHAAEDPGPSEGRDGQDSARIFSSRAAEGDSKRARRTRRTGRGGR